MQVFSGLPSDSPLTFSSTSLMYLGACAVCGPATCDAGCLCLVSWQRSGCPCVELVRLDRCDFEVSAVFVIPNDVKLLLASSDKSPALSVVLV